MQKSVSQNGRFILALHAGHNASACIGDKTGILYAIQEERLTREKNYWGFPKKAIQACLDYVGAKPKDISVIAYGGQQVLSRHHSREDILKSYQRQLTLIGKLRQRIAAPLILALQPHYGQKALQTLLKNEQLGHLPIIHYDHHLSHAASAYYGLRKNPAEKYLIVTCDGDGDGLCATVCVMGNGKIEKLASTHWNHSIGAIYAWVTYLMGFVPLEHEYKLMGMAPYTSMETAKEIAQIFHTYLGLTEGGLAFKRKTFLRTNDIQEKIARDLKGKRFDHICAGLQMFTEDLLCQWIENAVRMTGVKKVLAAGGVFMNVKANKKIAELRGVEHFEAFPSCGDETLPFGAYYLAAAKQYGDPEVQPLKTLYLGNDAEGDKEPKEIAEKYNLYCQKLESPPETIAGLLMAGHPVARCAGRMEFGARALCNRSILADPKNHDVVRIINAMVKKRDFWMPFAPVMLVKNQTRYIQNPKNLPSPYMMMTFDTTENRHEMMAAVHQADLTCRAQLLREGDNPELEEILKAFERKTDRCVLLNTSFNLHGFPIVNTPEEAIHVLVHSELRYLQVGHYLISKDPL